ncbi:MAG: hypothetical protein LBJ61_11105 [Deltaproteobacteria bacterium]|nr:hypothetical protein [Deltaproteobacteria bacterium]
MDGNPAGEPRAEAADGPTRKPVLTLVNPLSGGEKPARFSPELLDDESDYEDANLVRGQAAINLLSGYALTGQASKALDVYKTITEHDNVNEFVPIKSMAGLNLIRAFIQSRRWKEGAKYFREMLSLRKKADNSVLLAKAAVELIGFADKKNLAEAEEICSDLEGLSDEEDFILEHSRAVGNLIFIYGDFEELDKALALYESLDRFGDSLDILAVKAKSTVNLMSDYCVAKRPDLAEGLFQRLNDFGDHEVLAPSKVQGAHNLMAAYLKANEASRAEELFKGMARYGNGPGVGILRARAVFSLVSYYIHKKELEKTLEIYKLFDELGEAEDVFLEKGKALVNLVSFVGGLGLTTLAKTHFLEYHEKAVVHLQKMRMPMDDDYDFDEDFFENNASLAKLRNFPIGGFSEIVNHYVDFENDYYDIGLYNDTDFDTHDFEEESISSLLGKASFNLILDYTESGNFPEAEAIYMTMFDLDLVNRMVAHDIAQAGHLIISSAVPLGKWPLVMRVFESLDRLPKTQDINHQRCLVAIIILTYNNQRKLQISKTIYDILMEIQPKGPFGGYISKAALDTVVGLINEKQYEEALVVYKSMGDLGRALKTLERRAQAATYLIKAYESLGWLTEAKKVYQSMSLLGMGAKVTKLRLKAAKTLANLMNHSGLKEAADQLHEDTCGFRRFKKEGMNQEESKDGKSKKTLH